MIVSRRVRRTRGPQPADNRHVRVEMTYRRLSELHLYDYNPRDNEPAIESVANSIRTFGFLVPVVIDAQDVVAAGHTRYAAAELLGLEEVPTIPAEHLTAEQIAAFRLIDNKVAELAKWDFDLLAGEIQKLKDTGIVLTDFGWTKPELDCFNDIVQEDCLSAEGLVNLDENERLRRQERRAPSTARYVLGEIVFFIQATDYRRWVDGLRVLHDYDELAIVAEIKNRLGITEA